MTEQHDWEDVKRELGLCHSELILTVKRLKETE